jgi:hypothetical protein
MHLVQLLQQFGFLIRLFQILTALGAYFVWFRHGSIFRFRDILCVINGGSSNIQDIGMGPVHLDITLLHHAVLWLIVRPIGVGDAAIFKGLLAHPLHALLTRRAVTVI